MSFESIGAWGLKEWATAATIGSTVVQGTGVISNALGQDALAKANANAAEVNAAQARATAERNAQILEEKNKENKRQLQDKFEREQASRRAYFGKYGGGDASALEMLAGAAQAHEQDLQNLDYSTQLDVENVLYGGATQSAAQMQNASIARAKAQMAMDSLPVSLGSTLLSGGVKTYSVYKGIK